MTIYPVILSGGSGTRLWPLSRAALPKQLLALTSKFSLLQETALRAGRLPKTEAPTLVCNEEHRFMICEQMSAIGIKPHSILLEPVGRNTAPAITVAALALAAADPDAILLVLPSDHIIKGDDALADVIATARSAVEAGRIATFGVVPNSPNTGYGYIRRGSQIGELVGCYRIEQFTEKPGAREAERFIASGDYYWNSGMFMFAASVFLGEMRRLQPDIVAACNETWRNSKPDLQFVRLDRAAFANSPALSIDYAVMEHTDVGAVLPIDCEWSDVGSWSALWEVQEKNEQGNVLSGDVVATNVSNTLINAQSRMVVALGVRNLVIAETSDAVLVAEQSESQNLKQLVEEFQAAGRSEHINHRRVYRPWGYYESVDSGDRFQVKRLVVNPGASLSLQMHHHRAEHWVVVTGTAKVTRDKEVTLLSENQSTYIPIGVSHRLENPGKVPLCLIEVQSGGYLGEDDIVRFEDNYNRI